ncbi:MAG: hypothetical protein LBR43_03715 [Spiroplasmataceae bacterium]|nr:hypothetical protein [Spiroplasmataceae bacterium]
MKFGWIARLNIPHFRKERYYLVYKRTNNDYTLTLLNITKNNKEEGIDSEYQLELGKIIESKQSSMVNLNTLVFIEYDLFFKMIRKAKQPEKTIEIPKKLFAKIDEEVKNLVRAYALENKPKTQQETADYVFKELGITHKKLTYRYNPIGRRKSQGI